LRIKDFNIKPETLKLLEENMSAIFGDIGIGNAFLNRAPTVQEIRIDIKLNCTQSKSFCTVKETITRIKRKPTE
jgi:hypothetical protein